MSVYSVNPTRPATTDKATHLRISLGPECRRCEQSEADCARLAGCCPSCTHWIGYDAAGNPRRQEAAPQPSLRIVENWLQAKGFAEDTELTSVTPAVEVAASTGVTTGTPTNRRDTSWPFDLYDDKPARCPACGRRTAWRSDGTRWKHRLEADNPLAPYCAESGDAA